MNLRRLMRQKAVYWARNGQDGFGAATFATPVELDVRWEDRQEIFLDAAGRELLSVAVVYTTTAVVVGSYLYLGEEDDLSSDHSEPTVSEITAEEVKAVVTTTRMRGGMVLYKVFLK